MLYVHNGCMSIKRGRDFTKCVNDSQKSLFSLKTFKIDSILAHSLMNWYGFSQKAVPLWRERT